MKRTNINQKGRTGIRKKVIFILTFIICSVLLVYGINNKLKNPTLNPELMALEKQAEAGDTTALHMLLNFYDDNSEIYLEVEEAIDAYGNDILIEDDHDSSDYYLNELYLERLNYWLNKGIAIDDPVAKSIMGQRLYYEDEAAAIPYLAEMAEKGDGQAALFCGSACFNQGMGEEAFKYLYIAYDLGVPSAGWHLAMCYSKGFGTEVNKEKAVEVLKHSALMGFPEAVLEMKRIEPNNQLWQNKADSLEIDSPDFVIIDN